ncbi:hypothetical protein ACSU1N_05260 [Thermogladius sp. 4427co]|uniref:hypothetical protein n=1 Tax=Thermogladius sp. 4427co TaxID=3450718 RepID=UPI003F7A2D8F
MDGFTITLTQSGSSGANGISLIEVIIAVSILVLSGYRIIRVLRLWRKHGKGSLC